MESNFCFPCLISQEGTDINSYQSIEVPKGDTLDVCPIPPFVVFISSNRADGQFHLKIDRFINIHIAAATVDLACLRSMELLTMSHHLFNLGYHTYMLNVFSYFEYLMNVKTSSVPVCVAKLLRAVREHRE